MNWKFFITLFIALFVVSLMLPLACHNSFANTEACKFFLIQRQSPLIRLLHGTERSPVVEAVYEDSNWVATYRDSGRLEVPYAVERGRSVFGTPTFESGRTISIMSKMHSYLFTGEIIGGRRGPRSEMLLVLRTPEHWLIVLDWWRLDSESYFRGLVHPRLAMIPWYESIMLVSPSGATLGMGQIFGFDAEGALELRSGHQKYSIPRDALDTCKILRHRQLHPNGGPG